MVSLFAFFLFSFISFYFVDSTYGFTVQNVSHDLNASQHDRVLQSQYSDCVSCTSSGNYWCGDSQSCKGTTLQCGANCTAFSPTQCPTAGSLRCNGGSGLPTVNNYYNSDSKDAGLEYWLPELVVIVGYISFGDDWVSYLAPGLHAFVWLKLAYFMARIISPRCCCSRGKIASLQASAQIILRLKGLRAQRVKNGSEVEMMIRGVNGVAHANEDFFFKIVEEPVLMQEGSGSVETRNDAGGITVNPLGN